MSSLPSDEGLLEALEGTPGVRLVAWDLDGPPPCERIDIVVPPYWGGARRLAALGGEHGPVEVGLVQWQSIGYNGVERYLPAGLPLANATTVHEASTTKSRWRSPSPRSGPAEFVRAGDGHRWQLRSFPSLADRRRADRRLRRRGQGDRGATRGLRGPRSRVWLRRARTDRSLAGEETDVRGLDELHGTAAEIVMLAVPLGDETRGLIDAAALAAMPDGALLVNVAEAPWSSPTRSSQSCRRAGCALRST